MFLSQVFGIKHSHILDLHSIYCQLQSMNSLPHLKCPWCCLISMVHPQLHN